YKEKDLAFLVRYVCSYFSGMAQEREIDFAVRTPEQLEAHVDPRKIERVMMNLLSNAFKFTPPGGRIECELTYGEDKVMVKVRDSGPGIPPRLRKDIFKRFFQIEGGDKRRHEGTG